MENQEPNHSTQKEELIIPTPPPSTFPTPAHPLPKFLPKPIALIVIVLIIGALLSGLVFTAYSLGRSSILKELNPTAPAIPPADPVIFQGTPTPDPATADWQTYTKNALYTVKYPKDWKGSGHEFMDGGRYDENQVTFYPPIDYPDDWGGTYINVLENPNNYDLGKWLEENSKNYCWRNEINKLDLKKTVVGGKEALFVTIDKSQGCSPVSYYFVANDNFIFEIRTVAKKSISFDTFQNMVSTFKFTE